jgi:hypothetical protein
MHSLYAKAVGINHKQWLIAIDLQTIFHT